MYCHQIVYIIIIIITCFSRLEARCVCRQAAVRLPESYPLLDSPDPSKTQSTVGTALSIYTAPRKLGPICLYRIQNVQSNCDEGKVCRRVVLSVQKCAPLEDSFVFSTFSKLSGPIRTAERMTAQQIGQHYRLSMIQLPLVGFAESPSRALGPMELVPWCHQNTSQKVHPIIVLEPYLLFRLVLLKIACAGLCDVLGTCPSHSHRI
jgi:hypothetical protein